MILQKIISGGQTGVDRTALEVAEELGILTGGWVPAGCWTDEGQDPTLITRFHCVEHASAGYPPRTHANVLDADGTIWFGQRSPGYWCTYNAVRSKPIPEPGQVVAFADQPLRWLFNPTAVQLVDWLREYQIEILNVAGNRRKKNPAVVSQVQIALRGAIRLLREGGD